MLLSVKVELVRLVGVGLVVIRWGGVRLGDI